MAEIFWCARNLDTFLGFSGNHHFLVVKLGPGESLPPFTTQTAGGTNFVTLAAFKVNGRLQFGANQKADVTAVKEVLAPNDFKGNWTDYDLEYHQVTRPKKYATDLAFAKALVAMA